MRVVTVFLTLVFAIGAVPHRAQVPTTIEDYPAVVALLRTAIYGRRHTACGGAILNNRSVLSAARCFEDDAVERWSFRVGSAKWNSSGIIHPVTSIIPNENWDEWAMMTDVAIIRTSVEILFTPTVQPGAFSGAAYVVPDNDPLVTVGWGYNEMPFWRATVYEELRKVDLRQQNLDTCRPFYSQQGFYVSPNQLCSRLANAAAAASHDNCFGDPGMPVYHNNVIVGIRSYTLSCGVTVDVPAVNTRIAPFIDWIDETA